MSGIFLRRHGAAPCAQTCASPPQGWALIDEAEIEEATDELRHEMGLAESTSSQAGVELAAFPAFPADARRATVATSPEHVVSLGADLARDPAVQVRVLTSLANGSRGVTTAEPRMVRGGASAELGGETAQLELLRREVRDLKSQLRDLLEEHRAARAEAASVAAPAPAAAEPSDRARCLEGSLGVATLLLARCLVRRQQRQASPCPRCPAVTCARVLDDFAECFAGPAELVRDVRA